MRDLLLMAVTALCSTRALIDPTFGLFAYLAYGTASPQSFMWGIAKTFPHSKLIAAATLAGLLLSKISNLPRQREPLLLVFIWLMFGLSTAFAFDPEHAVDDLAVISKVFLMAFVAMHLVNSEKKFHLFMKVIALGLGVHAVKIGIFVIATGAQGAVQGPENTYLAANNTIGMALAMNVPLLYYLSKVEERKYLRWLMWVMMGLSYPAVVGTFARGAWVGLAAVSLLLVIKRKRKVFGLAAAGVLLIGAVIGLPRLVSKPVVERYDTLVNYEEDNSAESRFWNWEFCRRIGMAHPLTGAGFKFYSPSLYQTYYPEFVQRWGEGKVWSCHNMWLSIFAEHGLVALILWLSLLGGAFLSLRRIRKVARSHGEAAWVLPYTDMIQVSLVGFMIMGTFVDFPYYEIYYQLLAAVVIMKKLVQVTVAKAPFPAVSPLVRRPVLIS
jgi:probable O-glycosylation ligase (exosortase A-associated)